jgi:hypothetical protein
MTQSRRLDISPTPDLLRGGSDWPSQRLIETALGNAGYCSSRGARCGRPHCSINAVCSNM